MSLFVGRIPRGTDEKQLEALFSKHGKVTRCEIKRDGYGFVDFEDKLDAEDAVKELHNVEINGGNLVVELARGAGNGRGPRRGAPVGGCFKCGEPGHWARDCPNGPDGGRMGYGRGGGDSYRGNDRGRDYYSRRSYRSRSRSRSGERYRDDRRRYSPDRRRSSNYYDDRHRDAGGYRSGGSRPRSRSPRGVDESRDRDRRPYYPPAAASSYEGGPASSLPASTYYPPENTGLGVPRTGAPFERSPPSNYYETPLPIHQ